MKTISKLCLSTVVVGFLVSTAVRWYRGFRPGELVQQALLESRIRDLRDREIQSGYKVIGSNMVVY